MKYRKKPIVIDAIQLDFSNWTEIETFLGADYPTTAWVPDRGSRLFIRTLEGVMEAKPGDWIIRGIKGELYPCKDDIFRASYEEATDQKIVVANTIGTVNM